MSELEEVLNGQESKRVLFVYEEDSYLNDLSNHLSKEGFKVIQCESQIEVIENIEEFSPQGIIVDHNCASIDVYQLVHEIQNVDDEDAIVTILVYDQSYPVDYKESVLQGVQGFMLRSQSLSQSEAMIHLMMNNHNLKWQNTVAFSKLNDIQEKLKREVDEHRMFASRVAHDLRSPLSAIYTLADIAKQGMVEFDELIEGVEMLSSKSMDIIKGISELTKIETKKILLRKTSLQKMVEDCAEQVGAQFNERKPVFEIHCPFELKCSKTLFPQVFQNLFTNSMKFVEEGKRPHVIVSCHSIDNTLKINVEDNGPGIPDKYKETIFNAFERLHDEKVQGLGLGLNTTLKIIEAHHAEIKVGNSRDLGGVKFSITITKSSKNILILGFDKSEFSFLTLCLENQGHTIVSELDELSYVDVSIFKYDKISEHQEVFDYLSSQHSSVKVMAVGASDSKKIQASIEMGVDEYLMEPFTKEELYNRIDLVDEDFF